MFSIDDIPEIVAKIKEKIEAGDNEVAHAMEDSLHEVVISTIARCRKAATARALANAAVMVRVELSILYERWYG